ncbi:MAG: FAD-binding protein, partial [Anaerorhabdus sp.]
MKKLFKIALTLVLAFSLAACSSPKTTGYKAGTYTAEASGMNGPVKVEVTVTTDAIEKVVVTEHNETPSISDLAISDMPVRIVDAQGLGVDTVSGATITSKAILEAVALAMKDAGADVEALKKVTSKVQEKEEDKEYTADVIVIGAGGAGLAAGVTANQAGASVIVIEKMPKVGGNTILAGGALNAVDEGSETAIANKDSVELHYTQTYEGGDKQGDPELVRTLVTNAWDGVEWLQSLGMEFKEGTFTVLGGMWP